MTRYKLDNDASFDVEENRINIYGPNSLFLTLEDFQRIAVALIDADQLPEFKLKEPYLEEDSTRWLWDAVKGSGKKSEEEEAVDLPALLAYSKKPTKKIRIKNEAEPTKKMRGRGLCQQSEWRNDEGELHREDGPAMVCENGSKDWYWNGKLHREDGPATECGNGYKAWFLNGQRHREDGPAIEYANGITEWYLNGELHREHGPAIEWADGSKFWFLNGQRHRADGPAIEWASGGKAWWVNGKLHREDGPAVESSGGVKEWWLNGKRHRKDGPAIEWASGGTKDWFWEGKKVTVDEHWVLRHTWHFPKTIMGPVTPEPMPRKKGLSVPNIILGSVTHEPIPRRKKNPVPTWEFFIDGS